jgi:uncharacterized protein involved in exopolysaccharide biosynthesis
MARVYPEHDSMISHDQPEQSDLVDGADVSPLAFVDAMLKRRRTVLCVVLAAVVLAIVPTLVRVALGRRNYTSEALVTASSHRGGGSLSGLAAQLGVAVPGADPTQSPAFFVDLLKSPELLLEAATMHVQELGRRDSVPLAVHYRARGSSKALRTDEARRELTKRLDVTSSSKSGIITLRVTDEDPSVAAQVVERLLYLLGRVNQSSRRTQASSERQFTQQRAEEAAAELRVAEDGERAFLLRNRGCCSSPDLQLERNRLERAVSMRQQVYTQLVQAFEQARIEEVRDTPSLIVLAEPFVSIRPDSVGLLGKAVVGLIIGLGLGVLFVFLAELLKGMRDAEPQLFEEVERRLAIFNGELRRPWRLFRKPPENVA